MSSNTSTRVVETLLMHFIQIFPDAWEVWKGRSIEGIADEVRGTTTCTSEENVL